MSSPTEAPGLLEIIARKTSPRQRDLLLRSLKPGQNKQIARDLQMTEATVKAHLKVLLAISGTRSRVELILALVAACGLDLHTVIQATLEANPTHNDRKEPFNAVALFDHEVRRSAEHNLLVTLARIAASPFSQLSPAERDRVRVDLEAVEALHKQASESLREEV